MGPLRHLAFAMITILGAVWPWFFANAETIYFSEVSESPALDTRATATSGALIASPLLSSASLHNPAAIMFSEPGPQLFASAALDRAPETNAVGGRMAATNGSGVSGGVSMGGLGPFGFGIAYAQRENERTFIGDGGGAQKLSGRLVQIPLSLAVRATNNIALALTYAYLAENRSRRVEEGEQRLVEQELSGYALQLSALVALTENLSVGVVSRADAFLTGKTAAGERPRPSYIPAHSRLGATAFLDGPRPFESQPWFDLDTFLYFQIDARHTPQLSNGSRLTALSSVFKERPQASFRLTERGLDTDASWVTTNTRWTPRASLETLLVQSENIQASLLAGCHLEPGNRLKRGLAPHVSGGVDLSMWVFRIALAVDKGEGMLQRSAALGIAWHE